jgi:hypothetical protein
MFRIAGYFQFFFQARVEKSGEVPLTPFEGDGADN